MKTIFHNTDYKSATDQLNQLTDAQTAATLEENALLARLCNKNPDEQPSALERAKAMLTGQQAPIRQDHDGLQIRLYAVREKLTMLGQAIHEQRQNIAGLMHAQSAVINMEAKQSHIKAAERIKAALAGLRDAMQAEQSLRAEISDAGYLCSLEPLVRPELSFTDSQSTIARFMSDIAKYLALHELQAKRVVNVRLLTESSAGYLVML